MARGARLKLRNVGRLVPGRRLSQKGQLGEGKSKKGQNIPVFTESLPGSQQLLLWLTGKTWDGVVMKGYKRLVFESPKWPELSGVLLSRQSEPAQYVT